MNLVWILAFIGNGWNFKKYGKNLNLNPEIRKIPSHGDKISGFKNPIYYLFLSLFSYLKSGLKLINFIFSVENKYREKNQLDFSKKSFRKWNHQKDLWDQILININWSSNFSIIRKVQCLSVPLGSSKNSNSQTSELRRIRRIDPYGHGQQMKIFILEYHFL